ncbi:MAG: hypothetical protein GC160_23160 [Acidobacteria bacterium]|nr:hypothetical protein [Acidobacteriota bacterium]
MAASEERQGLGADSESRLVSLCIDYELGLLDPGGRAELEQKLAEGDPAAAEAMAEARESLGAVALATEPVVPEPALKQRLFEQIEEPAPQAKLPIPQPAARVPRWAALGWAVAAAMVAFVFFNQRQSDELRQALAVIEERQASLEQSNDRYRKLFDILSAQETRTIQLEAPDRARIRAFWNDQSGLALTAEGLRAPARGRAFQLWAIPKQGAPVSIEVFRPDEDDRALIFANPTIASAESQALAITEEDAAGAQQPTSDPIWMGSLQ